VDDDDAVPDSTEPSEQAAVVPGSFTGAAPSAAGKEVADEPWQTKGSPAEGKGGVAGAGPATQRGAVVASPLSSEDWQDDWLIMSLSDDAANPAINGGGTLQLWRPLKLAVGRLVSSSAGESRMK